MGSRTTFGHTPLAPGREFDLVRELERCWGPRARELGDDAAIVTPPAGHQLVISTDTSVEGVHFKRPWLSAREIGWRATTAALSDLAAMGASASGVLVGLVIPENCLPDLGAVAEGIGDAVSAANTTIIGGDLSSGPVLALAVTVLGSTSDPVRRRGARVGDRLYVTGQLGGVGDALRALREEREVRPDSRARFARPQARLQEGAWLATHGAHAMIDISDGLASEARHLAAASGVGVEVHLDHLPVHHGCNGIAAAMSGEEYELLVAGAIDTGAFAERFDVRLSEIGRVTPATAGDVLFLDAGRRVDLPTGYQHYSP